MMALGSSQILVFEVFGMDESQHRIAEHERVFTVIESPSHFIEVGREMLRRYAMPRSDDSAFEQRECALYGVRVNVSINVVAFLVLNRLVLGARDSRPIHRVGIAGKFIGHDHINVRAHVIADVLRQRAGLRILSMEVAEIATTLPDADHDLWVKEMP